ncbi:MAG: CTP synthase, partial [Acidimicrobiaceae bacterium]
GMQVMTVEFARNVVGLKDANSTEFNAATPHPVIDLMNDQREVTEKGGTMRLGAYYAVLTPGTKVANAYGEPVVM